MESEEVKKLAAKGVVLMQSALIGPFEIAYSDTMRKLSMYDEIKGETLFRFDMSVNGEMRTLYGKMDGQKELADISQDKIDEIESMLVKYFCKVSDN